MNHLTRLTIFLILAAVLLTAATRKIAVTVDNAYVPALLYYVAQQDDDPLTEDETDVSGTQALAWIQDEIDDTMRRIVRSSVDTAIAAGRTDLLPTEVANPQTQKQSAETAIQNALQNSAGAVEAP